MEPIGWFIFGWITSKFFRHKLPCEKDIQAWERGISCVEVQSQMQEYQSLIQPSSNINPNIVEKKK